MRSGPLSPPDLVAKIVQKIVLLWENFGPYHMDRLNAVAQHYAHRAEVIGLELSSKSSVYAWEKEHHAQFHRLTLTQDGRHFFDRSLIWQIISLVRAVFKIGRADFFFCHYEQPAIFVTAILLRIFRRRVFIMNDMKFADFERNIPREMIKAAFHFPYCGAIAAGRRSADYFRFMGIAKNKIQTGYGAVSLARLDSYLVTYRPPDFQNRPFIFVGRFMSMKNIFRIIDAYHAYRLQSSIPRDLHLCGSGPLEEDVRQHVQNLKLQGHIHFLGFLQAPDVTRAIAGSICLILFSTQETFGNVIIEAQALGVPVIASPICGATDEFLLSGVNGFLVEPDNVQGLANSMLLIDSDENTWNSRSVAGRALRPRIDISNFLNSVLRCLADETIIIDDERS